MEEKPKQEEFSDMPNASKVLQDKIIELEEKNKMKSEPPKDALHEAVEEIKKAENPNWKNIESIINNKDKK